MCIEAEIVGYGADGAGVARHQGQVIFVPGAARGDVCRLHITKALKNRAYARIDSLITPSAHRIENHCPAFPRCGGCDFRHIRYEEELDLKARRVRDALARLGGSDPGAVSITPAPSLTGYRNKAQFPVAMGPGGVCFGFYRRRSHDLVPITVCPIQDTRATVLAGAVCRWATETGTTVYDEQAHTGQLRHIYVRTAGDGGSHLCLVIREGKLQAPQRLVQLCRESEPGLGGIVVNVHPQPGNRVLGDRFDTLWGEPVLMETLMGLDFALSPPSFFQVNRAVTGLLYQTILDWSGDQTGYALDLYCGIGTIASILSRRFRRVTGVELVPQAIDDAKRNAHRNFGNDHSLDFLCADAGQAAAHMAAQGLRPDLIVCDPPRKGLDGQGIAAIAQMAPRRVLYVACDPASLARDVAALRPAGYELTALQAFDMFPRTANVETLCLLERA